MTKRYTRDARSPIPKSETVSRVMSANKAKNTKPELILRRVLLASGLRGLRSHPKKTPGTPDMIHAKMKVAVFVHGCYWHHCPKCNFPLPKHNRNFWKKKFARNQERDAEKLCLLKMASWKTVVVWEHEIKNDPRRVAQKIIGVINRRTLRVS